MAVDPCATGICGSEAPPLVGSILTGTGLTLEQAAIALSRGENPPLLTDVQRRIVEAHAERRLASRPKEPVEAVGRRPSPDS